MPEKLWALLFAGLGGFVATAIQYFFQRHSATSQTRREIIETHLLQLQDSVESLYYRINNLRDWGGKSVMEDDYFRNTSIYILGRVLAHERLLVTKGIYAKLYYDESLKRQLKARLHGINWGMDNQIFLYYYRVQLAEMLLDDDRVLSYTEFLVRSQDAQFQEVIDVASRFIDHIEPSRHDAIRNEARSLVDTLVTKTKVPSALSLVANRQ